MKKNLTICMYLILSFIFAFPLEGKADDTPKKEDVSKGNVTISSAGSYTITGSTTEYNVVITASNGAAVNITISDLNIDVLMKYKSAFSITNGANVTLTLEGSNVLKSANNYAGLHVSENSTLTIKGEGKLSANSITGAGIGGNQNEKGGTIKITGGEFRLVSMTGAGIGGGEGKEVGNITIEGGTFSLSSNSGAGIGGGKNGNGGNTTITGGNLTTSSYSGAGIGGGESGEGGTIKITGGTIMALNNNKKGSGIGGEKCNFSTESGNAFIIASSISDKTNEDSWSGVIFEGNDGAVYGKTITLTDNATIPSTYTLTVDKDKTLNLNGKTLTNKGTIQIAGKVDGAITNSDNGIKKYYVTYDANHGTSETATNYIKEDDAPSYSEFTYVSYKIEGWYKEAGCQNKVTEITEPTTVYAKWIEDTKIATTIENFSGLDDLTYTGKPVNITAPEVKDDQNNVISRATVALSYEFKNSGGSYESTTTDNSGAESNGQAPKYVGDYKVTAKFVETDDYEAAADVTAEFTIKQQPLTVNPKSDQIVLSEEVATYKPEYEVMGAVNGEDPGFTGALKLNGNTIENDDLTLEEPFATNYSLTIQAGVTVTIIKNDETANANITLKGETNDSGTNYVNQVTLVPPTGFLIKLVSSTQTKAVNDYEDQIVLTQEGTFDIIYKLKRNGSSIESDEYKTTVTIKKETQQPTEPDKPVVKPDPVYYTVSLPAVEGATTSVEAGDHDVESWASFIFYLTLDKDYDQSKPVVTTSRAETITPRTSDGAYVISYVRTDVDIYIDGIVKNPDPVGNETIEANQSRVWSAAGYLHIQSATAGKVYIFTADGRLQKTQQAAAGQELSVSLPGGSYIVHIADESFKVIL